MTLIVVKINIAPTIMNISTVLVNIAMSHRFAQSARDHTSHI